MIRRTRIPDVAPQPLGARHTPIGPNVGQPFSARYLLDPVFASQKFHTWERQPDEQTMVGVAITAS
jgi:hypothetical protein